MSLKSLLLVGAVILTTLPLRAVGLPAVPSNVGSPPTALSRSDFLVTAPSSADFLPMAPFSADFLPTAPFSAVDPVGAYCMLEQVVLEPDDVAPTRIQMWGAFAAADATATRGYAHATRGAMYYTCPPGRLAACRSEWADLLWISGTGKAIGYGRRGKPMGRLRGEDEAVASPDLYPLEGGLVKVESKNPAFTDLIAQLKAVLAGRTYLTARTFVASMTYIPRP